MSKAIGTGVCVWLLATALSAPGGACRAAETRGEGEQKLVRDGVTVALQVQSLAKDGVLREGEFADVRFRVTDTTSGQPLAGVAPGAWLDPQAVAADLAQGREHSCKSRVGVFLKSSIGARPLLFSST